MSYDHLHPISMTDPYVHQLHHHNTIKHNIDRLFIIRTDVIYPVLTICILLGAAVYNYIFIHDVKSSLSKKNVSIYLDMT